MKLTITREMLAALEQASDKPDWLTQRLATLRAGAEPYVLSLATQESTALEELCAMNIRFDAAGAVLASHQPLDDLATLIMMNY
jgi:hypothetical protein